MAKKKIAKTKKKEATPFTQWGDPVLANPTKPVPMGHIKSPQFKNTVRKMFKLIKGIGVGLAANQIGLPMRFAVVVIAPNPLRPSLVPVPPTTIVNPKIIAHSEEKQRG